MRSLWCSRKYILCLLLCILISIVYIEWCDDISTQTNSIYSSLSPSSLSLRGEFGAAGITFCVSCFVSSDRSSYSDDGLVYIQQGHFLRFWAFMPFYHVFSFHRVTGVSSITLLVHWSINPLVHWFIGPFHHWSIGLLVHFTIGQLVHWSIG